MGLLITCVALFFSGLGFGYLVALSEERRRWKDALDELADNDFQAGYETGHAAGRQMMLQTAIESTENVKLHGCGRN